MDFDKVSLKNGTMENSKSSLSKLGRYILYILLITLIIIQFFPTLNNKSDEVPTTDIIKSRKIPSQTATLIKNACYDCHSNNTDYPWYNAVQPISWYLEGHITNAKSGLNFNEFETYSTKKQKKKFQNMKFVVEENKMPLTSYKLMHAEGRLSKAERKEIINWIEDELKEYD